MFKKLFMLSPHCSEDSSTSSVWTFLLRIKWLVNPTKEYEEKYCHSK